MKIWSDSVADGEAIPERCAFGKHHPEQHIELTENKSPHIAWSGLPEGTRSLVLLVHDKDVPSKPDDVNQEGKTVPADLERADFYHWVLVDVSTELSPLGEGEFSSQITPRGKDGPSGPRGTRQGVNNYTDWFAGDDEMKGTYFGYDGPCPPWNDSIVHHYYFTLYALDVPQCPVEGEFSGPEVLEAIDEHILGTASFMGTYTINPDAEDRG